MTKRTLKMSEQELAQAMELHNAFLHGAQAVKALFSGPLGYEQARQYVQEVRQVSAAFVEWSGGALVVRLDPAPYRQSPEKYGVPQNIDFGAEVWQPFEEGFTPHGGEDGQGLDAAWMLSELQIVTNLWQASPTARRRHVTKDRLNGCVLGLHLHPDQGTADLHEQGGRDLMRMFLEEVAVYL